MNERAHQKYPRVLAINSRAIGEECAVGVTMASLFHEWPKDRIAQMYSGETEPTADVRARSWRLGVEHLRMPGAIRRVILASRQSSHSGIGRQESFERLPVSGQGCPETTARQTLSARCASISARDVCKRLVLGLLRYSSFDVSAQMRSWIADFRPEVIYSTLEDPYITRLVVDISRAFGIPVVPHIMDDWMRASFDGSKRQDILRRRLIRDTLYLIRKSPVRMSIGQDMSREYRAHYGCEFIPFMCCVDIGDRQACSKRDIMVFAYIGGLHLRRVEPLLDIADALEKLTQQGMRTEIVVYSRTASCMDPALLRHPAVRPASEEEMNLKDMGRPPIDFFVHVDSFDPEMIGYCRFSMSSKLPWMLASGIPIFAYGPGEISSISYIKFNGCGVVVSKPDPALMADELSRLMKDGPLRTSLGNCAFQTAKDNHDAPVVRESFRQALSDAALVGSRSQ